MNQRLVATLLFVVVIGVALAFRLPGLDVRPMHHDEANQAVKCGILQETGFYKYDAGDHHGPSLYYLTLPFAWLTSGNNFSGTSECTFRIVPVLFGVGLILLLLLITDGLGRGAVVAGAAMMAISPAMTFYSRFYIQEMLLVFFTLGAIVSGWRYFRTYSAGWAVAGGLSIGLMFVTKETSVIAYASMAGAFCLTYLWERYSNSGVEGAYGSAQKVTTKVARLTHLMLILAGACFIWIIFFSSFFTNWNGPIDSIAAYKSYLNKATESPHLHPWYYYLQLLAYWKNAPGPAWSEGLILVLALAGLIALLKNKVSDIGGDRRFLRFLSVYAVLLTVIYSVIPYKTPWCLLSFLSALILIAGVGVAFLLSLMRGHLSQLLMGVLLAGAFWNLGWQATAANFKYYADPRNPYVYAHTSSDFLNLVRRVELLSVVHPEGKKMFVAVVAAPSETWPLPWYLRTFPRTGFWQTANEIPEGMRPAVAVVSSSESDAVMRRLGPGYHLQYFGLRPDVLLAVLVSRELWDAFIKEGGASGIEKRHSRKE